MKIHTVTLELLRHGPAHNQLLSPLTPYLALCGNHGATTVQLPLEHADYLNRLDGLRYRAETVPRGIALREATRDVSRIFASIPALAAELSDATTEVIHLRLVLSASELAALPFELSEAPPGTPFEGQPLFLQSIQPVVMTRAGRRTSPAPIQWPRRPRILFVFASPPGLPPVPVDAHLLALRQALDPWIGWSSQEKDVQSELAKHLTVLPEASVESLHRVCEEASRNTSTQGAYTHVHILAHGVERPAPGTGEPRHYLAFHGRNGDRIDPIDGRRLEDALRPLSASGRELAVLTIASCDSGNVGSVIAPGAGVAHELHEAGVPLVVASQFPLTYAGSAIMVESLYKELLEGTDPRLAIRSLRRRLHAECPMAHDWASIVAYAALPPDIDVQLLDVRLQRTRKAGDVAIARVRRAIERFQEQPSLENKMAMTTQRDALDRAISTMEDIAIEAPNLAVKAYSWLGSMAVRWAEVLHHVLHHRISDRLEQAGDGDGYDRVRLSTTTELEALRIAQDFYDRTFRLDMSLEWALVQVIALRWLIEQEIVLADWQAAVWISKQHVGSGSPARVVSALGSLAELALLAAILSEGEERRFAGKPGEDSKTQLKELLARTGVRSFQAFSARRQMRRYATWWGDSTLQEIATPLEHWLAEQGVLPLWYER